MERALSISDINMNLTNSHDYVEDKATEAYFLRNAVICYARAYIDPPSKNRKKSTAVCGLQTTLDSIRVLKRRTAYYF